jgi:hypothetical protein
MGVCGGRPLPAGVLRGWWQGVKREGVEVGVGVRIRVVSQRGRVGVVVERRRRKRRRKVSRLGNYVGFVFHLLIYQAC